MIPVSTDEKNIVEKTFFVSTFLDKYKNCKTELEKSKTKMSKNTFNETGEW